MELRAVQACLRAGIEARATTVGPFLVLLNTTTDNPFLNYAVPVDNAAPTANDVASLIDFFTSRDRIPRLEYIRPVPAVDGPLRDAGFDVAPTLTLMAIDNLIPAPASPGYDVRLIEDESALRQAVAVQNIAYGESDTEADPIGIVGIVKRGGCVALAVDQATGQAVGAGVRPAPRNELVEIFGVGVLPEHRRHGLARLIVGMLTEEAMCRGLQPFLQVEKDEPGRIYERLGYFTIGEMADARHQK
ncbi:MAG TPA: GNAT family N-acetyltransferase [Pseudonocardiaceae bacterium]|nr:GNAT family N-acetyltransferase [Pseudonocardiaceae bacterium]